MLFSFGLVTKMLFTLINYTEKCGEWHLKQQRIKRWSKSAFLSKTDVYLVATSDRRRIEMGLR